MMRISLRVSSKRGRTFPSPTTTAPIRLRQAAVVADPAVIKALIKAGADVNAPNAEGETPLMIVARTG